MKHLPYWILATFMLTVASWAPLTAWGGKQPNKAPDPPRKVQDDANMFSKEAKEKANQQIAKIKSLFHKDLGFETVATVELPDGVDKKDKKAVGQFVTGWAADRFGNMHINGIYVVVIKDLHEFRIEVGAKTKQHFTDHNRDELKKIITAHIGKSDQAERDKTLLEGVQYVYNVEQKHAPAAVTTESKPGSQVQKGSDARRSCRSRQNLPSHRSLTGCSGLAWPLSACWSFGSSWASFGL